MTPTIEEKQEFFAQYFGQDVLVLYPNSCTNKCYIELSYNRNIEDDYLELKDLKNITDEDATQVAKYRYENPKMMLYAEIGKIIIFNYINQSKNKGEHELELFEIDFLRSKGYALPFRQYSVEQMIEFGWIKLI